VSGPMSRASRTLPLLGLVILPHFRKVGTIRMNMNKSRIFTKIRLPNNVAMTTNSKFLMKDTRTFVVSPTHDQTRNQESFKVQFAYMNIPHRG
jgi:hypothetical protein